MATREPMSEPDAELEPDYDPDLTNVDSSTMFNESDLFGGMLNDILGNYLEYEHGDGNTLNLVEALLLLRQSLDNNTKAIHDMQTAIIHELQRNRPRD